MSLSDEPLEVLAEASKTTRSFVVELSGSYAMVRHDQDDSEESKNNFLSTLFVTRFTCDPESSKARNMQLRPLAPTSFILAVASNTQVVSMNCLFVVDTIGESLIDVVGDFCVCL
ncbi:hypothetical protein EVAR_63663_1 [Eumeta japonica]|uniref:Uncharacterized protein n=1 Tax=Eumeta variegata TaxID=151549 RepID=A0A4C2AE86_EUMVA|nr:hypothetical protein EVAR_63663_1 [Eumeta japonica]